MSGSGESESDAFYRRAKWPLGTLVVHPDDPGRRGVLVQRCAYLWVDRDRKPPMVRWHGKIDAEAIEWRRLQLT